MALDLFGALFPGLSPRATMTSGLWPSILQYIKSSNRHPHTVSPTYREKNHNRTPPETSIRCPFIHFASSEHKKATTLPMSSGSPTLPKAVTLDKS